MNIDLHLESYRKECLIFWEVVQVRKIQSSHLSHVQIDNIQPEKNRYRWDTYNSRVYPFPSIWIMLLKSIKNEAKIIDNLFPIRIFICFILILSYLRLALRITFLFLWKLFLFINLFIMSFFLLFNFLKYVREF